MQQCLHLLVADRSRRAVLAQTIDGRWLLPAVACSERARATLLAATWLSGRHLIGHAVGQWLGRVTSDGRSIDWLLVIRLAPESQKAPLPLSWVPFERLRDGRAVLGYQQWAISAAVRDAIGVSGPFGSFAWTDDVESWVSAAGGIDAKRDVCFRASAHEVVLGLRSGSRYVYFKGLAADGADEARALAAASLELPASFPETLAIETRQDGSLWWLMAECPGVPMTRACTPRDCIRVAADVGRIQRQVFDRGILGTTPALDIPAVVSEGKQLVARAGLPAAPRALDDALDRVASLVAGWTPLDLDPLNVFLDEAQVRYIDLDVRLAPAPLALSIFGRRVIPRLGADAPPDLLAEMRRAYESEWHATIPWDAVDLVGHVVEMVSGWRRMMRNVERGEVTGATDVMASIVASRIERVWAHPR
jgi:hypothetical protein